MITKMFEIRDKATFMPATAVKLDSKHDQEKYLLRRAGYPDGQSIMLWFTAVGGQATSDLYDWGDRTRQVAHEYIEKNFDSLENGAVIDVEFILGEKTEPKVSESEESYG